MDQSLPPLAAHGAVQPSGVSRIVLQDYIDAVTDAEARIERLTTQIAALMPSWSLAPVGEAIQAMRGWPLQSP